MAVHFKVVFDAGDPHAQARFWAAALGYVVEDNSALIEQLLAAGAVGEEAVARGQGGLAWNELVAIRHPDDPVQPFSGVGLGRRVLFAAVPEPKTTKNRLHLDLHVGPDGREAEVQRLVTLGARVLAEVHAQGSRHTTLADPEGNEFDVQ